MNKQHMISTQNQQEQQEFNAKLLEVLLQHPLQNLLYPCENQIQEPLNVSVPNKESLDFRVPVKAEIQTKEALATCFLSGIMNTTDNRYRYSGTAFALSRKVVATNAHCVITKNGVAESIAIIPSLKEQTADAKIYTVKTAHVFPNYYQSNNYNNDFAILILEEELPIEVGKYSLYPGAFDRSGMDSLICENYSYPGDKTNYSIWYDKRLVTKENQTLVTTNFSYGGQSGSPIAMTFHLYEYPPVIAVHSAGLFDIVGGVKEQVAAIMTEIDFEKILFIRDTLPDNLLQDIVVY
ncbi:trypsin-like serine peptidase [Risungbinella massiliensis]|uniref:trypsin-like serine peptidase n=1 Tax=Risungbinella massiliensis TaxID=1329796 RepID=UPI0005CC4A56|nr:trypsin-like serine protease [Risungbinella massiliensis]